MMWIHATLILLLPETWGQMPVITHSAFNLGSDVNLTCSNTTWSEIFHVIWFAHLGHSDCKLAFAGAVLDDSCKDGKTLQNTSGARPFLHIPNFSNNDVGTYECEMAYRGRDVEKCEIHLSVIVPPAHVSSWLEHRDNKVVTVCKAERGKPAARISWRHTGSNGLNSTSEITTQDSDGSVTVESRLELLLGVDVEKPRCAISHPYWPEERILIPKLEKGYYALWYFVIIIAAAIAVLLIGILFFVQKKKPLRRCQQSNTSPSESAATEDVEEVEPYASYVQRENSIYISSADLFT